MNGDIAAQPFVNTDEESATYAKVAWRLLPFLFLCYLCAYLDRINVSFAKLQMASELALSDAVYGLGAGVFFIGYLMFEVPSNLILMKVGARRWIARIMVTWGLISACMMFVSGPVSFYVLRFLLGVAEAGFIPAILLYLTYWFPNKRRSKATALFLTGIPMSGVVGGPISGWIMHSMHGAHGWSGWQWLFLLEGLPTVLIGVIAFFYLDDRVADAKWLTDAEKARIQRDLAAEQQGNHLHSIRDGLTNPRVLLLSGIYFFFTMGLYGISFWLPSLVKASGVTDTLNIGLLSAVPYLVAVLGMIVFSRSSDATGERRWHLSIAGLLGAVGLAASVIYAKDTTFALIALTIGTVGVMATISQFWVLPPAILSGGAAAAGIALINSVGSISGVVSPYAIGWAQTAHNSTGAGVIALVCCLVIGSILVFTVPARLVNVQRQDAARR
ncbi:MFS transporter [Bordetella holmesii]|uniref:MFS transporter n=1 Tax=Bordetella holmesii TaxID=35814 RepID=UPI0002BBD598|nr:MFS transporter [Bordetella holmesii]AHV92797.1 major Facilitator Superfamily protein [Bordetella holmesii ATCC 51541]AUL20437.1 MFS transporter [Bordetella holmesii]AUL23760.1 MFS transporter [Bordetella holmesii]AUL27087.1 MFS transporter [Bordetella holmesii]AUL30433.1 MFS transporter [Bordetella holmesii]